MRPFVAGLAVLSFAAAGRAQGIPSDWTKLGDTVKVWVEEPPFRGAQAVVRSATPDTIFFRVRSAGSLSWLETPIAQERITRIAARDTARRSAARTVIGSVAGAAIGGVAGAGMIYIANQWICPTHDNDCGRHGKRAFMALGAVGVGAAGAIIGGILGSRPMPGWRRVFVRP